MAKKEIWRFVPGYEGLYLVSTLGRVKSCKTGSILKPEKTKVGYLRVMLCKDGIRKHLSIHRLVAMAFIPNPDNKQTVNHKDEDKANNCVWNLEWMSYKENNDYSDVLSSRRTPVEVYKDGELVGVYCSLRECARQLGIYSQHISKVLKCKLKTHGGYTFKYA